MKISLKRETRIGIALGVIVSLILAYIVNSGINTYSNLSKKFPLVEKQKILKASILSIVDLSGAIYLINIWSLTLEQQIKSNTIEKDIK